MTISGCSLRVSGIPTVRNAGGKLPARPSNRLLMPSKDLPEGKRILILAPLVKDRKGEYQAVFDDLRKQGYVRVRVDKTIHDLSEQLQLDKNKKHTIEVVIDRLVTGQSDSQSRIADSVETALKLGGGVALVSIVDGEEMLFSEHFACVHCEISLGEIAPRTFSFNSPHGACPACTGLGFKLEIDPDLIIPDKNLSISQGGIKPYQTQYWYFYRLEDIAREHGFSLNTPIKNLTKEQLNLILYGENFERYKYRTRFGQVREHTEGWEGVIPRMERLYRETESEYSRAETERYMVTKPCLECQGKRLKPEALAVTIGGEKYLSMSAGCRYLRHWPG